MLIFLQPIPRPAIWGGSLLREYFQYPEFGNTIGQSWSFSAQKGAGQSNRIASGIYNGQTLLELWNQKPELFQSRFQRFPVIVSLVAPMDDLSLQIHPNDRIAAEAGYATGKNEAWYFLEAEENAGIAYGLNAHDEAELRAMIAQNRWNDMARRLPVRQGDFVYLPAGVVHALEKGSIVYEVQQATDLTYRFYDYDRRDAHGNARPLHLEQAIRCIDYTITQADAHPCAKQIQTPNTCVTTFIDSDSFCVKCYDFKGSDTFTFPKYALMTCVEGEGTADGIFIQKGTNFVITADSSVHFKGRMRIMCTCEGNQ